MSGRMVPQFALAGLLAAALASPSFAQFDPVPGVYGGSRVDTSSPEVAPMPREKGAAAIEFESSIIPAGGFVVHPLVVPPPPRCAFDCQLNPVPAVPCMNQDTLVRVKETRTGSFLVSGGVNSDAGLSGNVIINERNFDLRCPTSPVVPGTGVMKFEWIQSNPAEAVPQLPRNLVELVGEFVCENNGDLRLVRFKAPAGAAMRGSGQSYPYPVRGLTTIRWDESGGAWWVETVRVPQPWDMPTQNGKFEHGETSWNIASDRLEDNRTCGTPTTTTVAVVSTPCSTKAGKLTGTWVREMEGSVIAATMSGDELKICLSQSVDGGTQCVTLIADYTLTKEGLVHGVITGVDFNMKGDSKSANSSPDIEPGNDMLAVMIQSLVDCPFSFRTRMTSLGLMVSNVKIALPCSGSGAGTNELLAVLCSGMFKLSKDGNVPTPKSRNSSAALSENGNLPKGGCQQPVLPSTYSSPSSSYPLSSSYPATGYGYATGTAYPSTYPVVTPTGTGYPTAPPPVLMMLPPAPLSYPTPVQCPQGSQPIPTGVPMGSALPASNNGMTPPQARMVIHFGVVSDANDCPRSNPPTGSTPPAPPGTPVAQVQSQRASDANFIEQYYKSERNTMPTPQPANVPAAAFDALADAFGQMLNAKQTPPVVVSSPQVCPLCPVQPSCTMQATGVVLPPCAAVVPVTNTGPVGTWVRVVGPMVYVIRITPDHMTVTSTSATGISDDQVVTESTILTADYHMMQDGTTMLGLITSFDVRLDGDIPEDADFDEIAGQLSHIQKAVTDKPFALSVRVYGNALAIGNVRLPEVESPDAWSPMTVLGGRYSAAGDKPLPKPRVTKAPMPPQGFPPPSPPVYGYPTGIIGAPTGLPVLPPPGIPQGAMPLPAAQGCFPAGSGTVIRVITQNPGCGAAGQPGCPLTPPGGVISGCGGVMIPPPNVQFGLVPTPTPGTGSPMMIPPPPVDLSVPMMPEPTPPATVEAPVTAKKSKKKQPTQ